MFLNEYEDDLLLDDDSCELLSDNECSDEDDFLFEGAWRVLGGNLKDILSVRGIRDWITGTNPANAKKFFNELRDFVKEDWKEDNKRDSVFANFQRNQNAVLGVYAWDPKATNVFLKKIADNKKWLKDDAAISRLGTASTLSKQLLTKNGALKAIDQAESNHAKCVDAWKKYNNTANSVIMGNCLASFAHMIRVAVRASH